MRLPLLLSFLLLLTLTTVSPAKTDKDIEKPDLSKCGKYANDIPNSYLECHVEADCLYGPRKNRIETPVYLRRYFAEFHPDRDIRKCATVIVVRMTPPDPAKTPRDWRLAKQHAHAVRAFRAAGMIDPAHFKTGVRFVVGQKIVMLSEEDGLTDDDEWLYASVDMFPVFNGTFDWKEQDGKIRIAVEAKARNGTRGFYKDHYTPKKRKSGNVTAPAIVANTSLCSPPCNQAAPLAAPAPATATQESHAFSIILGVVGTIALVGVGYLLMQRKRGNFVVARNGYNHYAQLPALQE